jgi:spore coat polysaccharide biosynthesis protein SpsF
MKVVGIIQARMGSKRLPGKSILPLAGKTLLHRFIERVLRTETLNTVVLATTVNREDDILCQIAEDMGIQVFRGSENDLVDRIFKCAVEHRADVIVRLCADNPLVEPLEIDRIVRQYLAHGQDEFLYTNAQSVNGLDWPDGLGAEVYGFMTFAKLWKLIKTPEHKEHPHKLFYELGQVKTIDCPDDMKYPEIKLDVNTQDEYEFVKGIYDKFGHNNFHFRDYIGDISGRTTVE